MTQDKRKYYFFPFQRIFKEEFDQREGWQKRRNMTLLCIIYNAE